MKGRKMDPETIFKRLKIFATPVLQRDLKPELQETEPKDSETVIGYYLPEDPQYNFNEG
jgi:hypothetical protein